MKKKILLFSAVSIFFIASCVSYMTKTEWDNVKNRKFVLTEFVYTASTGDATTAEYEKINFFRDIIINKYPLDQIIKSVEKKYNVEIETTDFKNLIKNNQYNDISSKGPKTLKINTHSNNIQSVVISVNVATAHFTPKGVFDGELFNMLRGKSFGMRFYTSVALNPGGLKKDVKVKPLWHFEPEDGAYSPEVYIDLGKLQFGLEKNMKIRDDGVLKNILRIYEKLPQAYESKSIY